MTNTEALLSLPAAHRIATTLLADWYHESRFGADADVVAAMDESGFLSWTEWQGARWMTLSPAGRAALLPERC